MSKSIAFINGGSKGIGLGLVKHLLDKSTMHVVATSRNPEVAKAAMEASLLSTNTSANAIKDRLTVVPLDVTNESTIANAAKLVTERFGKSPIRLLVNSTAMLHVEKSLRAIEQDKFLETLKINTLGPALMLKHFSPLLQAQPDKSFETNTDPIKLKNTVVANMSARTGSIGDNKLGGWISYRVSKAGVNQLTRTAAVELGRKNTIVVSLHPGTVDTDLSRDHIRNVPKDKLFSNWQSSEYLLNVIGKLTEKDNGSFLDYAGKPIEW